MWEATVIQRYDVYHTEALRKRDTATLKVVFLHPRQPRAHAFADSLQSLEQISEHLDQLHRCLSEDLTAIVDYEREDMVNTPRDESKSFIFGKDRLLSSRMRTA